MALLLTRVPSHGGLAQDGGGIGYAEVAVRGAGVSRPGEVEVILHVIPGGDSGNLPDVPVD